MVPHRRTLLPLVLAAALSACGGSARYANDAGPAGSIPVGAAITDNAVNISPSHFGAGLVKLVITNLTDSSQQLIVQSAANGSFKQETAPINPQDTAQLKADLGPGSYTVSVEDASVRAAKLAVGAPRPATVNQLP
jgi:hypothetical protein